LNLVRNASDAMSKVNDRPRHLLVRGGRGGEGIARLTVEGRSASASTHQDIEKLFERILHQPSLGGMGIGLSVSRSIVENHGGEIIARPNDGPGAAFSFSYSPAGRECRRRWRRIDGLIKRFRDRRLTIRPTRSIGCVCTPQTLYVWSAHAVRACPHLTSLKLHFDPAMADVRLGHGAENCDMVGQYYLKKTVEKAAGGRRRRFRGRSNEFRTRIPLPGKSRIGPSTGCTQRLGWQPFIPLAMSHTDTFAAAVRGIGSVTALDIPHLAHAKASSARTVAKGRIVVIDSGCGIPRQRPS